MPHFHYRNVNDAFQGLVSRLHEGTLPTDVTASRYGEVIAVNEPVIVTYARPRERVLFNPARDANPFFHLYESLWMLAGRNDVAPLAYYCSRMPEFSDDGITFNGAYGYRWRSYPRRNDEEEYEDGPVDQLDMIVDHLTRKPESRRAVLQMWTVEDDLLKIDTSKDVCCNLSAVFAVEDCGTEGAPRYLNMTVFNRSNDLIWGLLGANAVHFSVLQEYVAARLGVEVGAYHQVTANLHAYTNTWRPLEWLAPVANAQVDWYVRREAAGRPPFPLVRDPDVFDREVREFVERHRQDALAADYAEPFLSDVAQPMCVAYHHYKRREFSRALYVVEGVRADDWRRAAGQWLERRAARVR